MAVDKLKSWQDRLCEWLSDDSNYIIQKCGDILSWNEVNEIQKQTRALEKMQALLKIIIQKGEDKCQNFVDILRKNQEHYQQLQQFFNQNIQGSPTVAADSSSVVTTREINNIKGQSLCLKTEVSGPGCNQSGNIVREVTQANYMASGNSIICADKISNVSVDGDINLSVSVKTSQVDAGKVNESLPSPEDPAVKIIRRCKAKLIDCLMADRSFILNRVHTREIITDREYQNLKEASTSEETVNNLIDLVMLKGQKSCAHLLEVLYKPDVHETYPRLKDII